MRKSRQHDDFGTEKSSKLWLLRGKAVKIGTFARKTRQNYYFYAEKLSKLRLLWGNVVKMTTVARKTHNSKITEKLGSTTAECVF